MKTHQTGVIYCRVSSKEQVEGTSLGSQEKACKEYATRNDIQVLKVFIEKGESAKTANRTEFQKAIKFCGDKKNGVKNFIVYKLDRFTRSQEDHAILKGLFRKIEVRLLSATEPFDETPMGKAMEGISAIFAQLDNDMRSERCTNGMLERVKQGIWVWSAPLGYYRLIKGANLTPDQKVAPLIRLGFEEYSKGTYTYKGIAKFLNERGLKTRYGKPVSPQYMEKMLKNPLYCGIIKTWGEHKGAFEPIISETLFTKCQPEYMESAQASPRSANNPKYPLRRLIVCDECGVPLTGSTSTGRHRKKYSYYHHHDKNCHKTKAIPKEVFERQFLEYIDAISPGEEYEAVFKAIVLDTWKNSYKKIDEENEKIQRQITVLTDERQKVFDFHRLGKYSDEDFDEQKRLVNEKIAQKRLLIRAKWDEEFEMEEVLEYCFSYVRDTAKSWKEADYQERLALHKLVFIGRIQFDGEKLGTAELRHIYRMNQAYQLDKSSLVAPRGIEPLLPG